MNVLRKEFDSIEVADLVMILVGEIKPVGSHDIDIQREGNLIKLCNIVETLLDEIEDLCHFSNKPEKSVSDIGEYAKAWLAGRVNWINDCFKD